VIPDAVTVLPFPTLALEKLELLAAQVTWSLPITPLSVQAVVAVVVPSYTLLLAVTLAVTVAAVMLAAVVAVVEAS
jgi:hypothetical protein